MVEAGAVDEVEAVTATAVVVVVEGMAITTTATMAGVDEEENAGERRALSWLTTKCTLNAPLFFC